MYCEGLTSSLRGHHFSLSVSSVSFISFISFIFFRCFGFAASTVRQKESDAQREKHSRSMLKSGFACFGCFYFFSFFIREMNFLFDKNKLVVFFIICFLLIFKFMGSKSNCSNCSGSIILSNHCTMFGEKSVKFGEKSVKKKYEMEFAMFVII